MKNGLDRFSAYRAITPARVGLARAGDALSTDSVLDLRLAHARARDAIHGAVDFAAMAHDAAEFSPVLVHSKASDRPTYLRRPDWGRSLDDDSRGRLESLGSSGAELVLVVADGLSASAVTLGALPLVRELRRVTADLRWGPLVLAEQARVALGDDIGETLQTELCIVLIGERPGLSVSDSLGIYMTHGPRVGRTDAERNCISNIHGAGLSAADAAERLGRLVVAARRQRRSGVDLQLPSRVLELP